MRSGARLIAEPVSGFLADVAASRSVESSRPRAEKIVVANNSGSVSVCTLSGGCTANFTIPNTSVLDGVALALNGDCWASGLTTASKAFLVYFAHCRGRGLRATGFQNHYSGGLDVDDNGNLIRLARATAPADSNLDISTSIRAVIPYVSSSAGRLHSWVRLRMVTWTAGAKSWPSPMSSFIRLTSTHTARAVLHTSTASPTA